MSFTHSDLCELARRWLLRAPSARGPGCKIAFTELRTGFTGEVPDAIGWINSGGEADGSVVVEVKVSRSDFLADAKKSHRADGQGVGNWRVYMAPEGLIAPDELPPGWMLVTVNNRKHVDISRTPFAVTRWGDRIEALKSSSVETDLLSERFMLANMVARVADPEAVVKMLRKSSRINSALSKSVDAEREKAKHYNSLWWRGEAVLAKIAETHPELVEAANEAIDIPKIKPRAVKGV